jgi:hypothetical protein
MFSPLLKSLFLAFIFIVNSLSVRAQEDDSQKPHEKTSRKGFHLGLNMGAYFANSTTANIYNGYGFDANGVQNTSYQNSAMYEKLIMEYGGGNGQPDRIAPLFNLTPGAGQWGFDSADMPAHLKYTVAYMIGAQLNYCFDNKNAVILNVNATQLVITGAFTLDLYPPVIGPLPPNFVNVSPVCAILGQEERLSFQPGYQRMLGDNDQFCFFVEGGPIITMVKFLKNQIVINGTVGSPLTIDLTTYYNSMNYVTQQARNITGIGFGVFAGFGVSMHLNPKWTLQFLYNPSYERIDLGTNPPLSLQNSITLRACYKL